MGNVPRAEARDAVSDFCAGLLVPGLGQWLQGRRATGVYLFLEASSLLAVALAMPAHATLGWAGVGAVTAWAALDAARVARRHHGRAGR